MLCPYCGNMCDNNSGFCPSCGNTIALSPQTGAAYPDSTAAKKSAKRTLSKKTIVIIAITSVVILSLVIFAAVSITSKVMLTADTLVGTWSDGMGYPQYSFYTFRADGTGEYWFYSNLSFVKKTRPFKWSSSGKNFEIVFDNEELGTISGKYSVEERYMYWDNISDFSKYRSDKRVLYRVTSSTSPDEVDSLYEYMDAAYELALKQEEYGS